MKIKIEHEQRYRLAGYLLFVRTIREDIPLSNRIRNVGRLFSILGYIHGYF